MKRLDTLTVARSRARIKGAMSDHLENTKDRFFEYLHKSQERSAEIAHERELAAIRAEARALVWTGTQEEFVRSILNWYESGCVLASDPMDALLKAAKHFVRPDGTAMVKPQTASRALLPAQPAEKPKPTREAFVKTILEAKGWSILDWANESGVAPATAHDFLANKTKPYRSTRLKLAKSLGVSIQQLPR